MSADFIPVVKSGNAEAVAELLAEDPSLATATENGIPATMLAVYYGHPQVGAMIAKAKAEVSIWEYAALGNAAKVAEIVNSHPETINQHSSDGFTSLGFAAYFGHLELAAKLLSLGADPNIVSNNPLAVAPLHSALAGGQSAIALVLIQGGANLNLANGEGWTPLHYCADIGDAEMAQLLMERGANHMLRNQDKKTAAELAAEA